MKNKKLFVNDIILSAIIFVISLSVYVGMFCGPGKEYQYIEVLLDGEQIAEFSLTDDTVYEVANSGFAIEIKNRTVSVVTTDCNDKVCEAMHAGVDGGEIVCVPNMIVVRSKSTDIRNPDLVAG